jgi:hypothetical protein
MTGTTLKQSVTPPPGSPEDARWRVRGVADFDGDGQVDVLWHHPKTGALSVWKMSGTTRAATLSVVPGAMSDVRWKVASVVDFDGDARVDVLWHHQLTGELRVWRMEGLSRVGEVALSPSHQDPAWRLAPRWDVALPATVRRTRRK